MSKGYGCICAEKDAQKCFCLLELVAMYTEFIHLCKKNTGDAFVSSTAECVPRMCLSTNSTSMTLHCKDGLGNPVSY